MTPIQALELLARGAAQSMPIAQVDQYNAAVNAIRALIDAAAKSGAKAE